MKKRLKKRPTKRTPSTPRRRRPMTLDEYLTRVEQATGQSREHLRVEIEKLFSKRVASGPRKVRAG